MKSAVKLVSLRLLLLAVVTLLAAYPAARLGVFNWPKKYDPLAVPDLREEPGFLTSWQMKLIDFDVANCQAALALVGLPNTLQAVKAPGTDCEAADTVNLARLSIARLQPEDTRCAIAARLYLWEKHALQPAARRILGEEIAVIEHFGSYNCRKKRGGFTMSEHATANAFDIAGFRTQSGKQISLLRDWGKQSQEAKFLSVARDGLCDWFNVTLSPDYNAAHADHFHVDMGMWRSCR